MRVITAVEPFNILDHEVPVFLAGGITNCHDWQKDVIENLDLYDLAFPHELDNLVICNPRRPNFPIHDLNASEEQIKWEFNALNRAEIFTMYFTGGTSDQPICLYELGRNLLRMRELHPHDFENRIVISCSPEYKRAIDVEIQSKLVFDEQDLDNARKTVCGSSKLRLIKKNDILEHIKQIIECYKHVLASHNKDIRGREAH